MQTIVAACGSSPRVRGTRRAASRRSSFRRFIPRVRGTRSSSARPAIRRRFIPARAGNSQTGSFTPATQTVHPRACGELAVNSWPRLQWVGSSPRVRGTPLLPNRPCCSYRFIPARAGNSRGQASSSGLSAVHPRACGELGRELGLPAMASGSSPRVRGTPTYQKRVIEDGRFIPARAGNSSARRAIPACEPVHPRACGEL